MTGSGIEVLVEVGRARMCARCARETKCCVMGARASLPAAGGHAGGRRGCHSHGNLQFSCSLLPLILARVHLFFEFRGVHCLVNLEPKSVCMRLKNHSIVRFDLLA